MGSAFWPLRLSLSAADAMGTMDPMVAGCSRPTRARTPAPPAAAPTELDIACVVSVSLIHRMAISRVWPSPSTSLIKYESTLLSTAAAAPEAAPAEARGSHHKELISSS